MDCQLPFGLISAPAIFSAIAEALKWIRSRSVRNLIHYLDKFLLLGAPGTSECLQALHSTLSTCQELGIPLALHKIEGPKTQLIFLGIGLDSSQMSISLLMLSFSGFVGFCDSGPHFKCIRDPQQFQSLLGHLVHMIQVISLGKA